MGVVVNTYLHIGPESLATIIIGLDSLETEPQSSWPSYARRFDTMMYVCSASIDLTERSLYGVQVIINIWHELGAIVSRMFISAWKVS